MLCRSDHRTVGGLVLKQTTRSLQGEGCHVELNFVGSRGTSLLLAASWPRRKVSGRIEWTNWVITEEKSDELGRHTIHRVVTKIIYLSTI